ncbi:hypothetical protein NDU88_006253 [Pleurodeles waltl]|uniref:Uncharacterized protein n=1 Tax=Pleurodeles waltl TaxID=8319 RepID=A0AAV7UKZ7_PLEWA|nr:hypothetical protein NDU88_006253 [Pleurodeles waltl]
MRASTKCLLQSKLRAGVCGPNPPSVPTCDESRRKLCGAAYQGLSRSCSLSRGALVRLRAPVSLGGRSVSCRVVADKPGRVCYPSRPRAGKELVQRGEAPSWVSSARIPVPSARASRAPEIQGPGRVFSSSAARAGESFGRFFEPRAGGVADESLRLPALYTGGSRLSDERSPHRASLVKARSVGGSRRSQ